MATTDSHPATPRRNEGLRDPERVKVRLNHKLHKEFEANTKRLDDPPNSFICHRDVQQIWAKRKRIQKLLYPDDIPLQILDIIQNDMIVILSILVSIGADTCLANFRTRFFDPNTTKPVRTDINIPLDLDQIDFLPDESPARRKQFYDEQWKFVPEVIQLSKKCQEIHPMRRLPFEHV